MKLINTSSAEQANLDKFKAKINGWITSIGLPYHLDDLTPDGGIYTIFCPVVWKELYSAHELKTALKQDVDAEKINIEYIDFKRLIPTKQPLYTTLPAEQPSEDLEKFIQDLIDKFPVNKESVPNDSLNDYYQGLRFGVLQGVQWQKEQMMKGFCYETKVYQEFDDVDDVFSPFTSYLTLEQTEITALPNLGLQNGDKVKILIIKEDEQ